MRPDDLRGMTPRERANLEAALGYPSTHDSAALGRMWDHLNQQMQAQTLAYAQWTTVTVELIPVRTRWQAFRYWLFGEEA